MGKKITYRWTLGWDSEPFQTYAEKICQFPHEEMSLGGLIGAVIYIIGMPVLALWDSIALRKAVP